MRRKIFDTVKFILPEFPSYPRHIYKDFVNPVERNYYGALSATCLSILRHASGLVPYPCSSSADGNTQSDVSYDVSGICWRTLAAFNNDTKWSREEEKSLREGCPLWLQGAEEMGATGKIVHRVDEDEYIVVIFLISLVWQALTDELYQHG